MIKKALLTALALTIASSAVSAGETYKNPLANGYKKGATCRIHVRGWTDWPAFYQLNGKTYFIEQGTNSRNGGWDSYFLTDIRDSIYSSYWVNPDKTCGVTIKQPGNDRVQKGKLRNKLNLDWDNLTAPKEWKNRNHKVVTSEVLGAITSGPGGS